MGGTIRAVAPSRHDIGAWCGIGALSTCVGVLGFALGHHAALLPPRTVANLCIFLLALSSGCFMTAGVVRLTRWRLARDAHSALVGAALVLMGGLTLPLVGFALLLAPAADPWFVAPAARTLASFTAMYLVVRALGATEVTSRHEPGRLLPRLLAGFTLLFVLLVACGALAPDLLTAQRIPPQLMSMLNALGWLVVATRVAMRGSTLPWAYQAAPLFFGMSMAETLRSLDRGTTNVYTLAGMLVCTAMAALAARSAFRDLEGTVSADEHEATDLFVALERVTDEADELSVWRQQLTHDARNACAGLRAAMTIMERYDGQVDPDTAERLRLAAVNEIGHLEHLLTRSGREPLGAFEVTPVVRQVAQTARVLGARTHVTGPAVRAQGNAGDLAAVLKNLLVNAQTHAPGSRVDIVVAGGAETITIMISDDGPGFSAQDARHAFERGYRGPASPGSGLGLYAARELMREQGGDLTLGDSRLGATFHLTLSAVRTETSMLPVRVPAQRGEARRGSLHPAFSERS